MAEERIPIKKEIICPTCKTKMWLSRDNSSVLYVKGNDNEKKVVKKDPLSITIQKSILNFVKNLVMATGLVTIGIIALLLIKTRFFPDLIWTFKI